MAKATQDDRVMNIRTPLGKDVLLLSSFKAEEEISRLFSITAELLHEGTVGGDVPHEIVPNTILGKAVAVEILQRDGTKRFFHGMVNRFEQRNREERFTHYQAEIVPQIWLLTQIAQSKIFQKKTVPEILQLVLKGFNASFQFQRTYEKRNYCVQYRETDFEFVSRLMEEEGIFYFFEHTDTTHKMIIGDVATVHPDCPNTHEFSFDLDQPSGDDFVPLVREWVVNHRLQTGKITFWDHNFELPFNRLDATEPTRFPLEGKEKLEVYDYPGGYSRKFDGIDSGGSVQAGELNKVFADKDKAANLSMEAIDSRYKIISGVGECSSMTAGHAFNLVNHPLSSNNGKYVITSISHSATQSPDYASEDVVLDPYDNAFNCIPVGANAPVFRPERITPKPLVTGSQTATVVGPPGEEIFTDKYGRVKVQFRWDRHGKMDSASSCWIRVAQSWAGNKWGTMFIPRIGMEAIVDFIEGDPDRPIITGCVYNAETMPPYTLPDEKTKSTIKTNSTKGGGGFNELRFEDKKGSEQIFINAEKDQDIRVKNIAKEIIGMDRHLIVKQDQNERVERDKSLLVKGNQNEKVNGSVSLGCGGSQQLKVSQKYALDAGQEIHLKAGMTTVIEAGTALTLKVGGNFININPGGIFIKGTMVMLNSGGAAGSGSGASPTEPKEALEAVTAEAGSATTMPPAPPAPNPPTFSALQTAVQQAAAKPPSQTVAPTLPISLPPLPTLPNLNGLAGPSLAAAQSAVQSAVNTAIDEAKNAADKVKDTVAKVQDIANDMVDNAVAVAEAVMDRVEAAKQAVEEKIDQVTDAAKEAAESAIDKATDAAKKATESAQKAAETAKEAASEAKDAADAAVDTAEQAAGAAADAATSAAESAMNAVPFM